jgi:fatty acid desaturase
MSAGPSSLVLTDPSYRVRPLNVLERAAMTIIRDPRDLPFVWLIVAMSVIVIPVAALLICDTNFPWWLAAAYLLVVTGTFSPILVMYHEITHRPLFRPQYRFLMHYINWVFGPLFGLFPNVFYAHHIAMHHAENNLGRDLSSTMHYQRDSLADFLGYAANFQLTVMYGLVRYLWRRKRFRLVRAVLIGEASFFVAAAVVACFNWKAALVVFVIPLVTSIAGFSLVNWTEHAFIDHAAPQNLYRSAIVCVNTLYNWIGFNDGYHISHHLNPNLHWTDKPEEFRNHRTAYAREGAIVFQRLNYYLVFLLLLTKRYGVLARHCADVVEGRRSEKEMIQVLQQRAARLVA